MTDEGGREREGRGGRRERSAANLVCVEAARVGVRPSQLVQLGTHSNPEYRNLPRMKRESELRPLEKGNAAVASAGERMDRHKARWQCASDCVAHLAQPRCVQLVMWVSRVDSKRRQQSRLFLQHGLVHVRARKNVCEKRTVPMSCETDARGDPGGTRCRRDAPWRFTEDGEVIAAAANGGDTAKERQHTGLRQMTRNGPEGIGGDHLGHMWNQRCDVRRVFFAPDVDCRIGIGAMQGRRERRREDEVAEVVERDEKDASRSGSRGHYPLLAREEPCVRRLKRESCAP